ncbi:MAG: hypothetical protein ABWX74_19905 [Aeromicrobium sp.]
MTRAWHRLAPWSSACAGVMALVGIAWQQGIADHLASHDRLLVALAVGCVVLMIRPVVAHQKQES